jgi:hypothetical protein
LLLHVKKCLLFRASARDRHTLSALKPSANSPLKYNLPAPFWLALRYLAISQHNLSVMMLKLKIRQGKGKQSSRDDAAEKLLTTNGHEQTQRGQTATTDFGRGREAKRHAAFGNLLSCESGVVAVHPPQYLPLRTGRLPLN